MVVSESSLNCLMKVLLVSPLPRGHIKRQVFNASIFLSSYLHFMLQHVCLRARCAYFLTQAEPKSLQGFASSSDTSPNPKVLQKMETTSTSYYKTASKFSVTRNIQYNFQGMIHLMETSIPKLNWSLQALFIVNLETKTVFFPKQMSRMAGR